MNRNMELVIVGVGGQGILTVSDILGSAAISEGLNAVMSEVHGMAQRGGVVTSEMKLGDFKSPLIGKGEAHVILGFEPVETYRILEKASRNTRIVTNLEPLVPPSVSTGKGTYPSVELLVEHMKNAGLKVIGVKALELAGKAGSPVAGNSVMLGALASLEGFILSRDSVVEALKKRIGSRLLEPNLKAFDLGYEAGMAQR
jgi:indolepyruvate ferredoxin oxidoreductase, beta subunit